MSFLHGSDGLSLIVNRGHLLQIENTLKRASNSCPLPADRFHTAGIIFILLLNGKMENRNETRLVRLFVKTILLPEQVQAVCSV